MDASSSTTTATPLPVQQLLSPPPPLVGGEVAAATAGRGSAWEGSRSVGPFFAVISVVAILAVLSCVWGRKASSSWSSSSSPDDPLHGLPSFSLKRIGFGGGGSWFAWVRRRWRCGGEGGAVDAAAGEI